MLKRPEEFDIITTRKWQLQLMHELMREANDEDLYDCWIRYAVPDEPSDLDFDSIAQDKDAFNECLKLFQKLIADPDYPA